MSNKKPLNKNNNVGSQNKAFFKEQVRPLYKSFDDFYHEVTHHFPRWKETGAAVIHTLNIYYGRCAPGTDDVIELRALIKHKQSQDELQQIAQQRQAN